MKTASHTFNTVHGNVTVDLDIFVMDWVEAVDVYDLDRFHFGSGGWRVEGKINGTPRGTRFYPNNISSAYVGEDTEDAAREFLAAAHQDGFFSA
jgi:hypothetical protein